MQLADIARSTLSDPKYRDSYQLKPDGSAVTQADLDCEQKMRQHLASRLPEHGIHGEEFDDQPGGQYCWVLDPLDGTSAFVSGSPLYCSLIGLQRDERPLLGIIELPHFQQRLCGGEGWAAQIGADGGKRPLATSQCTQASDCRAAITYPARSDNCQRLLDACAVARYGGDGCNFAYVAQGTLDLAVEEGLQAHDILAVIPVIEAAGGCVADFAGNRPTAAGDGSFIAAANPELLASALQILAN